LAYNGGAGEQRTPSNFDLREGDCSSRLLSGAELQTTSGCSSRAPVALDAQRPEQRWRRAIFYPLLGKILAPAFC